MAGRTIRAQDRDSLTNFLGWFSIALGTAQVTAPRALCRAVGARGEGHSPVVMRLLGVRELAQGIGILSRPRPTGWLWSRVAGDGLDLSLLGLVAAKNEKGRGRAAFAIANVLAVTVPDILESLHLTQKRGEPQAGKRIRKAVTISRPRDEVEHAFNAADELRRKIDEEGAQVHFAPAPGNRGTELAVEWEQRPLLGEIGAAAGKLAGRDLATELADDLRRLKQQIETGEIVRSDAVPEGHLLGRHVKQRSAQPLEEPLEEVVR